MCKVIRSFSAIPIVAAALGMALAAAPAQADIELEMQVSATGATSQMFGPSSSPLVVMTTIGSFYSLQPASGSTLGSTPASFLLSLTGSWGYSSASTASGNQVLSVDLSAINVTAPAVPAVLSMLSTLSGTYTGGSAPGSTLELQAWVNSSNTPFAGPPGGPPNTDSGAQPIPTGTVTNTSSGFVTGNAGMYAVDVLLTWTIPSGTAPGTFGLSPLGSTDITPVAPAPSNLVLGLASLPVLGAASWIRRRKTRR
jgi:hypothetical protein